MARPRKKTVRTECPLCRNRGDAPVLTAPAIPVWTNSPRGKRAWRYPCVLRACRRCGHVYQPLTASLRGILRDIYASDRAQMTTPLGIGSLGTAREEALLREIKETCSPGPRTSVLEIGCGNGRLLSALAREGVGPLTGIEPSLRASCTKGGAHLIKGSVDGSLNLGRTFDLIIAIGVLEHIPDLNGLLSFVRAHLSARGRFFFSVPDCAAALRSGDPALFAHQHLHYFTRARLHALLACQGLRVISSVLREGTLSVIVVPGTARAPRRRARGDHARMYQKNLARSLARVRTLLATETVLVHGVNNALNNIVGWTRTSLRGPLTDNDETKHGKVFFGVRIGGPGLSLNARVRSVAVVPTRLSKTIAADYRKIGFTGPIGPILRGLYPPRGKRQ